MMEMSASAWEEYEKHYKAGYEKGRADQKHEDLDSQVILTKNEIKILEIALVKKILTAIESEYDLNYGEMLLNPRDFYDLVEGFYPTITPPTKDDNEISEYMESKNDEVTEEQLIKEGNEIGSHYDDLREQMEL